MSTELKLRSLTAAEIASAVGGKLEIYGNASPDVPQKYISTNSKESAAGVIFCAIKGQKADGNEFITESLEMGSDCFICQYVPEVSKNSGKAFCAVIVDDTIKALFSREEMLEILAWNISDKLKIRLLELSNEEISIIGKNYSPAVCLHILNNNFAKSDLPDLFSSFEQWDNFVQEKIFDYAVRHIASIIDGPNSVSQKLTNNLLQSERVNRDEKIDLFIAIIPVLCEDSIKGILTLLNLTDYLKIFDTRSRPKFEINDENEKLLTAFKESNLIDNYEENPEKEGYYKIIRHKPITKSLPKELL